MAAYPVGACALGFCFLTNFPLLIVKAPNFSTLLQRYLPCQPPAQAGIFCRLLLAYATGAVLGNLGVGTGIHKAFR